jgi:hypothetical protein
MRERAKKMSNRKWKTGNFKPDNGDQLSVIAGSSFAISGFRFDMFCRKLS